jgi:hypothetical protein
MKALGNIGNYWNLLSIKFKIEDIAYGELKDKQHVKMRAAATEANRVGWNELAALRGELSYRRRLARETIPCCITCRRRL